MRAQDYQISKEKFVFHNVDERLHDKKLETKPVSYLQDAFRRFARNKASIVATFIIGFLILFAIFGPMLTPYQVKDKDPNYAYCLPRNEFFYKHGIHFWDGGQEKELTKQTYDQYRAIELEIKGRKVIMTKPKVVTDTYMGKERQLYKFRLDTYNVVGIKYALLKYDEYVALQKYQDEHNVQIIYPMTDPAKRPQAEQDINNANIWYETRLGNGRKTEIVFDENGNFKNIYWTDTESPDDDKYTSKMLWEGDTKLYRYAEEKGGNMWNVRVDYYEYYKYIHDKAGDGITKPSFLLGANNYGMDIFSGLASGARFSFILAIIVASVNLVVGAIYGAIEGYYGGKVDLIMERIVDILGSIPSMIVITLLKYHLNASHIVILFISFFATGWVGMAARTRMQFYRFKNQEYVLVARTLGARDRRIMFKHIFPNAIGTLITGSVLVIPGVIFSETSLSYLGIINLSTGNMTSVGTLLATGQNYLFTFPHMILFPSIFISLLMLSFNLFGNGLRDAFNPSLRGNEE
ncbi:MAG: ABC transporter permease [Clostridia bacterium]|nr:ABC transporter permease [Clostridia bacterium]